MEAGNHGEGVEEKPIEKAIYFKLKNGTWHVFTGNTHAEIFENVLYPWLEVNDPDLVNELTEKFGDKLEKKWIYLSGDPGIYQEGWITNMKNFWTKEQKRKYDWDQEVRKQAE